MNYFFLKQIGLILSVFFLFPTVDISAQNKARYWQLATTAGYDVANSPKYTKVVSPSFGLDFQYLTTSYHTDWGESLGFPLYGYALSFQTLGNADVLGNAVGIAPVLRLQPIKKWKHTRLELGLGLAYMSQVYNRLHNPLNTVVGSPISFYGRAKIERYFELNQDWTAAIGLGVSHYSNGNFVVPNLGVNVPALTFSVIYNDKKYTPTTSAEKNRFERTAFVSPFLRGSLGGAEREFSGPKYAIYTGAIGLQHRLSGVSRVQAGMEYIFNSSPYYFMTIAQFYDKKTAFREASRVDIFLGYEFLFGHFGFLAEGGIYLNRHFNQKSLFTTKLGFQYYPFNALKYQRFMPFMGLSVRAYFGEAEFVELSSGIYF